MYIINEMSLIDEFIALYPTPYQACKDLQDNLGKPGDVSIIYQWRDGKKRLPEWARNYMIDKLVPDWSVKYGVHPKTLRALMEKVKL